MAENLQRGFEIALYGKDTPKQPRRCKSICDVHLYYDESAGSESPSSVTQLSPTFQDEKFDALITEQEIPSATTHKLGTLGEKTSGEGTQRSSATWEPSISHFRPISGLGALGLAVACVFSSLIILLISDNQPVDSWAIKPSVYLAIVTAVANSALALARAQAVPLSWWYRASCGASIRALECHWHTTSTLGGALVYGKASLLSAACIATTFAMIDGPLLQKASTVKFATETSNITLHIKLLPELPAGFSGTWQFDQLWYVGRGWWAAANSTVHAPMELDVPDCVGTCRATVQAPGVVERNCTSQTWPIDRATTHNPHASWGNWQTVVPHPGIKNVTIVSNPAFYVNLVNGQVPGYPPHARREGAYLTVGLAHWVNWEGAYVERSCWLKSAIVEYDVIIQDNTIKFDGNSPQGRLVSLANNTLPADIGETQLAQATTLDGFTKYLSMFVNANASVSMDPKLGGNAFFSTNFATFTPVVAKYVEPGDHDGSFLGFKNPTEDVIMSFNQMMLRGGINASSIPDVLQDVDGGVSFYQTVEARQTVQQNIFKSDLRWYAGAAAIELLTVLLILPMFWGWWTLGGGNYTMSPFTMALAFDSPLLGDINSAAGAKGVVRELGNMQVKFGLVGEAESGFERPHDGGAVGIAPGRLGIAEGSSVFRPIKGMKFAK